MILYTFKVYCTALLIPIPFQTSGMKPPVLCDTTRSTAANYNVFIINWGIYLPQLKIILPRKRWYVYQDRQAPIDGPIEEDELALSLCS